MGGFFSSFHLDLSCGGFAAKLRRLLLWRSTLEILETNGMLRSGPWRQGRNHYQGAMEELLRNISG
jgi:hypothetical protein